MKVKWVAALRPWRLEDALSWTASLGAFDCIVLVGANICSMKEEGRAPASCLSKLSTVFKTSKYLKLKRLTGVSLLLYHSLTESTAWYWLMAPCRENVFDGTIVLENLQRNLLMSKQRTCITDMLPERFPINKYWSIYIYWPTLESTYIQHTGICDNREPTHRHLVDREPTFGWLWSKEMSNTITDSLVFLQKSWVLFNCWLINC